MIYKCKVQIPSTVNDISVIECWNKQNDISTLLKDKAALIVSTKEEIKDLKSIQKIRAKKPVIIIKRARI